MAAECASRILGREAQALKLGIQESYMEERNLSKVLPGTPRT